MIGTAGRARASGGRLLRTTRDLLTQAPRLDGVQASIRGRGTVFRMGHRLRDAGIDDMFFIIGSGRSGTTLVRRILMSSPRVNIPPELHVVGRMLSTYRRYSYLAWGELVALCLAQLQFHREFRHLQMDLSPVARDLRRLPRAERSFGRILHEVIAAHAATVGRNDADRYGEKTPNTTEEVFRLRYVLPRARFVHVVRDGRDVARSFAGAGLFPLEEAAHLWVRRTSLVRRFAARHPDACLTISYERLVTDPDGTAGVIAAFLSIDPASIDVDRLDHVAQMADVKAHDHHAQVAAPIRPYRIGRWRDALTKDEIARLERIMGDELVRWGYSIAEPTEDQVLIRVEEAVNDLEIVDANEAPHAR